MLSDTTRIYILMPGKFDKVMLYAVNLVIFSIVVL